MIEENLINFGALGLWTISNLSLIFYFIRKGEKREDRLVQVVENNTQAITLFNNRKNH